MPRFQVPYVRFAAGVSAIAAIQAGIVALIYRPALLMEVPTFVELEPVEPGLLVRAEVEVRNLTQATIRCIGSSYMCSFGCASPEGIPFEVPPRRSGTLWIEYHAPNRDITETTVGSSPVKLFFDHPQFREAVIDVNYTVLAGPRRVDEVLTTLP